MLSHESRAIAEAIEHQPTHTPQAHQVLATLYVGDQLNAIALRVTTEQAQCDGQANDDRRCLRTIHHTGGCEYPSPVVRSAYE